MQDRDPNDFWDLSDLVPKRKQAPVRPVARDTTATEVTAPPQKRPWQSDPPPIEHFVPPHTAEELRQTETPEKEYRPTGGLIRAVRIYPWKNEYDYYETFRRQAQRLRKLTGQEAPFVDFFSYMPQYDQLSRAQLAYYLWWRTSFESGRCLPAAYSYLLLYLYEIINLDTTIDPVMGRDHTVRLWLAYREKYPRLDVLIREWLCDYCLVHELPPPTLPPVQFNDLVSGCRLREFYVGAAGGEEGMIDALLYFGSNYDYKKSKFYRPETAALFDRALRGAVCVTLAEHEAKSAQNTTRDGAYSQICRDAFSGAVCSYHLKKRIEIDYCSFSHTHELRFLVTDALKYAENAVRASLGVKSRLTVYALNADLREKLDAWFATVVPPRATRRAAVKEQIPDYEKRYDLPRSDLSPEKAAAIEEASWQITERLVTAFADEPTKSAETGRETNETKPPPTFAPVAPEPAKKAPTSDTLPPPESGTSGLAAALGNLLPFVRLCADGDGAGQRDFALSLGSMPDAVADRVNTVAADVFGDVILEQTDGRYAVISDYLIDLEKEGVL